MWHYIVVFFAALLVDIIPFVGPPAWTVMVLLQTVYDLDIVWVIAFGVVGSTVGRYLYSLYIPYLSERLLKKQKNDDIQYIGQQLDSGLARSVFRLPLYTIAAAIYTIIYSCGYC